SPPPAPRREAPSVGATPPRPLELRFTFRCGPAVKFADVSLAGQRDGGRPRSTPRTKPDLNNAPRPAQGQARGALPGVHVGGPGAVESPRRRKRGNPPPSDSLPGCFPTGIFRRLMKGEANHTLPPAPGQLIFSPRVVSACPTATYGTRGLTPPGSPRP